MHIQCPKTKQGSTEKRKQKCNSILGGYRPDLLTYIRGGDHTLLNTSRRTSKLYNRAFLYKAAAAVARRCDASALCPFNLRHGVLYILEKSAISVYCNQKSLIKNANHNLQETGTQCWVKKKLRSCGYIPLGARPTNSTKIRISVECFFNI